MDPAATFLHRHERRAIARRRKGEVLRALVPVMHDDRPGLLAVSPTRLLHAQRTALRTRVQAWRRRDMAGMRVESTRYGVLIVLLRSGQRVRFEFVSRDDCRRVEQAIVPPQARARAAPLAAPGHGTAAPRPSAGRPMASAAPDPLAHRGSLEHQARLRQLHARGVLTKAELDWQLAA